MTDATLFEVIPARRVDGSNFPLGVIEFPFSVGRPNAWVPAKSYFRISSTIYGAPVAGPAVSYPLVSEMIAFADNAVGTQTPFPGLNTFGILKFIDCSYIP